MHDHNLCCDHHLKFCGVCDVVYCTKCKREWGRWVYYQPTYPYIYPTWTTGLTTTDSYSVTVENTAHVHE